MKRLEEIEAAAKDLAELEQCDFINGAEWSDANPSAEVKALVRTVENLIRQGHSEECEVISTGCDEEDCDCNLAILKEKLAAFHKSRGGK